MRLNPDFINPPAFVIMDERGTYQKQLREAHKRQQERDELHLAWIDNLFHGEEYKSIFEEFPELLDKLPESKKVQFKKEIEAMGHPKYDAGRNG